jgi:hypothetical protein
VTPWLKQYVATDAAIGARKPVMQRVLQTGAKRTVRRCLARRQERVGRVGLPSTPNAIYRSFWAFERFYKTRQGVHAVLRASGRGSRC